MAIQPAEFAKLDSAFDKLVAAIDKQTAAADQVVAVSTKTAKALPVAKPFMPTATIIPDAVKKEAVQTAGAMDSLSFGINQTLGAFSQVTSVIEQFLGALDPALVEQLSWALRNVTAALATALRPVALVLVDVLRQLAGVILPIAQALAPLLGELAGILAEAIVPVVDAFADITAALLPLMPAIQSLARQVVSVVVAMVKMFATFATMFAVLYETLGIFDLITSVFKVLEDVVKGVIRAMVLFIATVAKFFGGEQFVKAMAEKFKAEAGEKGTPAVASAQNFAVSSVMDLLRAQQVSAAKAVGGPQGAAQKTTENFLAEIGGELEGIAKDGTTFMSLVEKMLAAILKAIQDLLPKVGIPGDLEVSDLKRRAEHNWTQFWNPSEAEKREFRNSPMGRFLPFHG